MGRRTREDFHKELCDILGTEDCYFRPPSNIEMRYPCAVYDLSRIDHQFADNRRYLNHTGYMVTVIDEDPDSSLYRRLLESELVGRFDRKYISNGLNHFVFTLYF